MSELLHIALGSLLLSLVHASIPNHWLPIVLVGKSEGWSTKETVSIGILSGFLHTLSTILLGSVIGYIGLKLSEKYEGVTSLVASLVLIGMGLIYFWKGLRHDHHEHLNTARIPRKSKKAIVTTFAVSMFFSPCLEIESYYFNAGMFGMAGIALVSVIYLLVTVTGMAILVYVGCKSLERYNFNILEHHEKKITGGILIILGITSYFFH